MTLWIWKGDTHSSICRTSNNTGDGSVSQMGKLRLEVLIHLDKCSRSISNTSEASNLLDITFKNRCFFGPLSFHSLDPCVFKNTFLHGFIFIKASCSMRVWKHLLHGFYISHFTFTLQNPISLGLPCTHACSKTLVTWMGFSQDIHFFSIYIVLMASLFVLDLANTT